MQTTMLIAQNSAPLKDMGAATGAATFLRNMGGSLGVSVLGALYTSTLADSFTSAGGAAGAGNAGGAVAQMTPEALRNLPEAVQHAFAQAVSDGVGIAFAWGAGVAVIGIVLALFIRHVPLRGFGGAPGADKAPVEVTTAEHAR
jgi:hypothetical protein